MPLVGQAAAMGVQLTKDSIDLGIIVRDGAKALAFYRDVLGLEHVGDSPMPGGTMHRLNCGTTLVKLVAFDKVPEAANPPGGIQAASGYRYFTISVSNMEEVADAAKAAGHRVPVGPVEFRPGVRICMIEDPDGNWVELLTAS